MGIAPLPVFLTKSFIAVSASLRRKKHPFAPGTHAIRSTIDSSLELEFVMTDGGIPPEASNSVLRSRYSRPDHRAYRGRISARSNT